MTCGGTAGVRVPLHWTPSSRLIALAGAEMFVKSSLPLSRFVTVRLTFAGRWPKFATVAVQCETPVFAAKRASARSCASA